MSKNVNKTYVFYSSRIITSPSFSRFSQIFPAREEYNKAERCVCLSSSSGFQLKGRGNVYTGRVLHKIRKLRERGWRISNNRQWSNQLVRVVDTRRCRNRSTVNWTYWASVVNREWPTTPSCTFHTRVSFILNIPL